MVLPQPDSPTSPSVVAASMLNEIESTARTRPVAQPSAPRRTVKCFVRFDALSSGARLDAAASGRGM